MCKKGSCFTGIAKCSVSKDWLGSDEMNNNSEASVVHTRSI